MDYEHERAESDSEIMQEETVDETTNLVKKTPEISPSNGNFTTWAIFIKGLIGISILLMSQAVAKAGIVTSVIAFVLTTLMSLESLNRIAEIHILLKISIERAAKRVGGLGLRLFLEISIVLLNLFDIMAYIVFVNENIRRVLLAHNTDFPNYGIGLIFSAIVIPCVYIKNISKVSIVSVIGFWFMTVSLIAVFIQFALKINKDGRSPYIDAFGQLSSSTLIFGIFTNSIVTINFEYPIFQQSAHKSAYSRVTSGAMISAALFALLFTLVGYLAYGASVAAPITLSMDINSWLNQLLIILYAISFIATSIICFHPIIKIVEVWIVKPIHSSSVKFIVRAVLRIGLFFVPFLLALFLYDHITEVCGAVFNFLGGILSYFFAGVLHLVLIARSKTDKIRDWVLIVFGIFSVILCIIWCIAHLK